MAEHDKLFSMLTDYLVAETNVLEGITYALYKNDEKGKKAFDRYSAIKQEVINNGLMQEAFRIYVLSNGYIFDMDLKLAKKLALDIIHDASNEISCETNINNIIAQRAELRKKSELEKLGKYLIEQYDKGEEQVEVALYNKNATNNILVTGIDNLNNKVSIKYRAYSITHNDIELLNKAVLNKSRFKVDAITPVSILPNRNGVTFILVLGERKHENNM